MQNEQEVDPLKLLEIQAQVFLAKCSEIKRRLIGNEKTQDQHPNQINSA